MQHCVVMGQMAFLFNPFPNKYLNLPNLECLYENFRYDKNGRKFSKRVEKIMGKGEIAHYEQFLLLPWSFQRTCTANPYKHGLVWERVNCFLPKQDF